MSFSPAKSSSYYHQLSRNSSISHLKLPGPDSPSPNPNFLPDTSFPHSVYSTYYSWPDGEKYYLNLSQDNLSSKPYNFDSDYDSADDSFYFENGMVGMGGGTGGGTVGRNNGRRRSTLATLNSLNYSLSRGNFNYANDYMNSKDHGKPEIFSDTSHFVKYLPPSSLASSYPHPLPSSGDTQLDLGSLGPDTVLSNYAHLTNNRYSSENQELMYTKFVHDKNYPIYKQIKGLDLTFLK